MITVDYVLSKHSGHVFERGDKEGSSPSHKRKWRLVRTATERICDDCLCTIPRKTKVVKLESYGNNVLMLLCVYCYVDKRNLD